MAIIDGTYRDDRYGTGIYNYLLSVFHNPYGVSALMGNLQAESFLTPYRMQSELSETAWISYDYAEDVVQGNITRTQFIAEGQTGIAYNGNYYEGTGFGLAQWTYPSRKADLYQWRIDMGYTFFDTNCTVTFLIHELETNYRDCYYMIINATAETMDFVTDYILANFENPEDQSESVKRHRRILARAILRDYGGVEPTTRTTKRKYPWVLFK